MDKSTKIRAVELEGIIKHGLLKFELKWSKESKRERDSLFSVYEIKYQLIRIGSELGESEIHFCHVGKNDISGVRNLIEIDFC